MCTDFYRYMSLKTSRRLFLHFAFTSAWAWVDTPFFSKNLCDMVKSAIALTLFAKNFQRSENSSIDKVFFFVPQVKSNLVTPRNGEPLVAPIQDFITGVKNKYKLWSIPTNTVSVLFFYDAGIQGRKNKVTLSAPSQLRQLYISLNKG